MPYMSSRLEVTSIMNDRDELRERMARKLQPLNYLPLRIHMQRMGEYTKKSIQSLPSEMPELSI